MSRCLHCDYNGEDLLAKVMNLTAERDAARKWGSKWQSAHYVAKVERDALQAVLDGEPAQPRDEV